jgi:hypothetical protein
MKTKMKMKMKMKMNIHDADTEGLENGDCTITTLLFDGCHPMLVHSSQHVSLNSGLSLVVLFPAVRKLYTYYYKFGQLERT